jgi:hypothetical protein
MINGLDSAVGDGRLPAVQAARDSYLGHASSLSHDNSGSLSRGRAAGWASHPFHLEKGPRKAEEGSQGRENIWKMCLVQVRLKAGGGYGPGLKLRAWGRS